MKMKDVFCFQMYRKVFRKIIKYWVINNDKMTNVYKEYPNGMKAIAGLTVNIKQGEFVYVVGPSGAGKSTFIKMMYREEKPSTGSINVNGLTIETLAERDVPYFRRQLGVIFQDFKLLPKLTVYENVSFALEVIEEEPDAIRERVTEVLGLVGLEDRADALQVSFRGSNNVWLLQNNCK